MVLICHVNVYATFTLYFFRAIKQIHGGWETCASYSCNKAVLDVWPAEFLHIKPFLIKNRSKTKEWRLPSIFFSFFTFCCNLNKFSYYSHDSIPINLFPFQEYLHLLKELKILEKFISDLILLSTGTSSGSYKTNWKISMKPRWNSKLRYTYFTLYSQTLQFNSHKLLTHVLKLTFHVFR
jgi:hypothetical protein